MVAAMIATLVAPKSVRALVATLVRDVDNPARATILSSYGGDQTLLGNGNFPCIVPYVHSPTTTKTKSSLKKGRGDRALDRALWDQLTVEYSSLPVPSHSWPARTLLSCVRN
jgi:hypothetical protein